MTDTARLTALFDAALVCQCDVCLYDHNEPEAATALALWASDRHLPAERHSVVAGDVLSVPTSKHRSISVYLIARAT